MEKKDQEEKNSRKKVGEIIKSEQTKRVFLNNVIDLVNKPPEPYSVEEKFLATKKNTNYLGLIILFGFCFILVIGSFFVIRYFESRQEKINLTIDEFSDINIQEILEQASNFKNELVTKRSELQTLKDERDDKVYQVNLVYETSINSLIAQNLSPEVRDARRNQLVNDRRNKLASIGEEFSGRISELEAEIKQLSSKVNDLDQEAISQAVKADDFVNYQKTLFEAQIKTLEEANKKRLERTVSSIANSYESKISEIINTYNPNVVSANAELVLNDPSLKEGLDKFNEIDFNDNSLSVEEFNINNINPYFNDLTNFVRYQKNGQVLLSEYNNIKFYNKTKDINQALQLIHYQQFNALRDLYEKVLQENQKQNLLSEMLNYYLQENSFMAIVVDKTDTNLHVFMRDFYKEEDFSQGIIFDALTKEQIGEITIEKKSGLFYQAILENSIRSRSIPRLSPVILF